MKTRHDARHQPVIVSGGGDVAHCISAPPPVAKRAVTNARTTAKLSIKDGGRGTIRRWEVVPCGHEGLA